jgi:hypothetical protein
MNSLILAQFLPRAQGIIGSYQADATENKKAGWKAGFLF